MKPRNIPLTLALAAVALSAAGCARADAFRIDDGGLHYRSASDAVRMNLGGRLHLDSARFRSDGDWHDDAATRRARLDLQGKLGDALRLRAEREMVRNPGWRNLYLAGDATRRVEIKAGQFTAPLGMEDLQSTNSIPFAERSLMNALAPGYALGAQLAARGRHGNLVIGRFGNGLDGKDSDAPDRGRGWSGRLTAVPWHDRHATVHLGLGLEHRHVRDDERLRFSASNGSSLANTLIATPRIGRVNALDSAGAEFAVVSGRYALQAQYLRSSLDRDNRDTLQFDGAYVQAGWLLGGARYRYADRSGMVAGPRLRAGTRAVELALRGSCIDLDSGSVRGGSAQAVDVGVVYYHGRNVRLMGTWTNSWFREQPGARRQHDVALVARLQIAF